MSKIMKNLVISLIARGPRALERPLATIVSIGFWKPSLIQISDIRSEWGQGSDIVPGDISF